jgi:hypothetical protein
MRGISLALLARGMIVNGLFPIGESPTQESVKGPAVIEDGSQGGDFSTFLFLILAAPANQIAQGTGEAACCLASENSTAQAVLRPATPDDCGEDSTTYAKILPVQDQSGEYRGQPKAMDFTDQTQLWGGLAPHPTPEPALRDGIKTSPTASVNDGAEDQGVVIHAPKDFLPWHVESAADLGSLTADPRQSNVVGNSASSAAAVPHQFFPHIGMLAVEAKTEAEASNDPAYYGRQSVDSETFDEDISREKVRVTLGAEASQTAKGNSHNDKSSPWLDLNQRYSAIAKKNLGEVILRPTGEHPMTDGELKLWRQPQAEFDPVPSKSTVAEIFNPGGEAQSPDSRQGGQDTLLQHGNGEATQAPVHASVMGVQHNTMAFQVAGLADNLPTEQATEPTLRRSVVEQVAKEINGRIRIGKTEAVIQLDPPELGRLKIALRVDGEKLEARITAESHDSRVLIESHLHELRQALGENRVELLDVRVDGSGWGNAHGGGQDGNRQEANGGRQPETYFGGPVRDGSEEREPVRRQSSEHEPGRVSMWA